MRHFYVYIMASKSRVLYTGVTNNIHRRVWEHKHDKLPGFTSDYRVHRLVYFETFQYVGNAIAREKTIKGWLRGKKVALIESLNSTWEDLSEDWYGEIKPLTPLIPASTEGKPILRCAQDDKHVNRVKMTYQTLQLAFDAGIATITLNRPDKRNAISFQLLEELLAALDEIERSPAQVVILTGAGKAFCAGLDLDELKSLLGKTHDENVKDSARVARIFRRLYEFPRATIAAVNGAAIAGGTGLATMCDFTLAVPEAKFGYTEVRIGFVPAIVSSILVWQVGHKIARDLLLTGRLFDATEAHRYGLVNEVVAPERLLPRARDLAAQILENSPSSVRATKKLINSFIAGQLDQQIATAIEDNAHIRTTADFREGISSFLEKRKPQWSGK
ncbi:MAG: enoyl-CoA hydratase/isomerase family protein [Acidobacteriia bacterium]|nr:enoyl-CoA hydratase/isomerase family protein [Terriglobia bacterium]